MYCIWTVHLYQRRCWRLINELDAYSITAITALLILHHCTGVYFIQRVSWLNTAMQHCNLVKYHIVATPMLQKHSSHQIQRVCAPYVIIGGLWKNTSPDCLAPTGDPAVNFFRFHSGFHLGSLLKYQYSWRPEQVPQPTRFEARWRIWLIKTMQW